MTGGSPTRSRRCSRASLCAPPSSKRRRNSPSLTLCHGLGVDHLARAAKELGVEVAAIRAIAGVGGGRGPGSLPDGRPSVLYEAHLFQKHSKGAHGDGKIAGA